MSFVQGIRHDARALLDFGPIAEDSPPICNIWNYARRRTTCALRDRLTVSVPIAAGWSAKLTLPKGLVTRVCGDYKAASLALRYRWFDR